MFTNERILLLVFVLKVKVGFSGDFFFFFGYTPAISTYPVIVSAYIAQRTDNTEYLGFIV